MEKEREKERERDGGEETRKRKEKGKGRKGKKGERRITILQRCLMNVRMVWGEEE